MTPFKWLVPVVVEKGLSNWQQKQRHLAPKEAPLQASNPSTRTLSIKSQSSCDGHQWSQLLPEAFMLACKSSVNIRKWDIHILNMGNGSTLKKEENLVEAFTVMNIMLM